MYQGSVLLPFLLEVVVDVDSELASKGVLSEMLYGVTQLEIEGVLNEMLYVDDLVLNGEMFVGLTDKFRK